MQKTSLAQMPSYRLRNLLRRPEEGLANYLAEENITCKFNTLSTPNFCRLWKEGIESVKYHLKRTGTVGNARLIFQELLIVAQTESILNPIQLF